MATFDRRLDPAALESLDRLASSDAPNWWRELLLLWAPSGHQGELRIAIRNGSLNFYSKGQSIAQVSFDNRGHPRLRVHRKYVTGDPESRSGYIIMNETGCNPHDVPSTRFDPTVIRSWIENSARYRGPEKTFVDKAVVESSTVVDLEMGLPANQDQASTLRMDMVALERSAGEIRIVFWEAKMMGDARLSSSVGTPEVLRQVQAYEIYLRDNDRRRRVIEAYRRNCRLLLAVHEMAVRIAPKPGLDPLVRVAATSGSSLTVEEKPRLLIFDDGKRRREEKWKQRVNVLQNSGIIVRVVPPAAFRLSDEPAC